MDRKYYLVSDHLSMETLFRGENQMSQKSCLFTRIRRAVAVLLEYDITFIHVRNTNELIHLVDALSRKVAYSNEPLAVKETELGLGKIQIIHDLEINATKMELPPIQLPPLITKTDIVRAQDEDQELKKIKIELNKLEEGEFYEFKGVTFTLKNSIIHTVNKGNFLVIKIPDHIAYEVLSYIHNSKDHCSVQRLIFFVNKINFHFNSKYKMAKLVVDECYLCQITQPRNKDEKCNYHLRPSLQPFKNVRIDLVDFGDNNNDFRYLLTVLDSFSLFLEVDFLENKTAKSVCRSLALILTKYNMEGLSEITSDNGTEFNNKDLEEELRRLNVVKFNISPLNPHSNRVERVHKEIKRLLKIQLYKSNWDFRFKVLMSVRKYNATETKALDYKSPVFVLLGYEADFLGTMFDLHENKVERDDVDYDKEDVSDQVNRWVKYHESVITQIATKRFQNYSRTYEELDEKIEEVKPGDIVALKFGTTKGESQKLRFSWRAPYVIKNRTMNSVLCECLHTKMMIRRNLRMVKRLKLDENFANLLKSRNYVINQNFFYPVNTISDTLDIQDDEIMEQNLSVDPGECRKLRNGKTF